MWLPASTFSPATKEGQESDWVFVIGLEDGHIPDFRSATDDEVPEELRVLHVIVSRARYGLVVTFSCQTPTKYGWRVSTLSHASATPPGSECGRFPYE